MLAVPNDLKTFRDTVSGGIGNMNSTLSTLKDNISKFSIACTKAQSGVNQYYNSQNKSVVIGKFAAISSLTNSLSASLSGYLQSVLSKSQELIDKVNRLDELVKEVEAEQAKINKEKQKKEEDRNNSIISTANDIIAKDTKEFNTLRPEADNALIQLKSSTETVDVSALESSSSSVQIGEVKVELQGLQEGTYNEVTYTAKNGRTIKTYIYLPQGASQTEGLGVMLYMGGDGSTGHGLNAGVGKQLKQGAQYNGIVVVLEAENDKSYSDGSYLDASKELADNIVKTYNAAPNGVSISGYSYGGSGVQHMVERYPDYFSQAVIVAQGTGAVGRESSSKEEAYDKLRRNKIHIICGTSDSGNYADLSHLYSVLSSGGNVTAQWIKGGTHSINTANTIQSYVEYCLAQRRG